MIYIPYLLAFHIYHVLQLCEMFKTNLLVTPRNCHFQDLANAGATKRPTCCVLVLTKPTKGELGQEEQDKLKGEYDQVATDISELANSMF